MICRRSTCLWLPTLALLACQPERGNAPEPIADSQTEATPGLTANSLTVPHPWVGKIVQLQAWSPFDRQICVDIPNNDAVSGKDLLLDLCNPVNKQLFRTIRITPTSAQPRADLVAFQSMSNPSLCLDFEGGTANGGERLQLFPCHNGSNQAFALPWPNPFGAISNHIFSGVSAPDASGRSTYATRLEKASPRAWWIPVQARNVFPLPDNPEGQMPTRWHLLDFASHLPLQGSYDP
jgi:hypothetical protein